MVIGKIGRKTAFLVRCDNCNTKFWRTKEQLGVAETCGVCLKTSIFFHVKAKTKGTAVSKNKNELG